MISFLGYWFLPAIAQAADVQIKLPVTTSPNTIPELFQRALQFLTALAYPLAFLAILYTAFLLIMAGGKPDGYAAVKKNIVYITIGLFLIIFAVIMMKLVVSFICSGSSACYST